MRITTSVAFFGLSAILSLPSMAQVPVSSGPAEMPSFLLEGLHELANQNPEEAEKAWVRGTISADEQAIYANQIRSVMASAGPYQNFDVVSVHDFTGRLRVIYLVLNFERMPNIARFLLYRTGNGWVLIDQQFNVDARTLEPAAQSGNQ